MTIWLFACRALVATAFDIGMDLSDFGIGCEPETLEPTGVPSSDMARYN